MTYTPLLKLAPKLEGKPITSLLALMTGTAIVVMSAGPGWGQWDAVRVASCVVLLSFHGAFAAYGTKWPGSVAQVKRELVWWPDRWFAKRLKNPLDAAMVRQALQVGLPTLPGVIGIVVPSLFSVWSVILFVIGAVACTNTAENLQHILGHNRPFTPSKEATALDRVIIKLFHAYVLVVVLPAAFQIYPWYFWQHNYNHHIENNGPEDVQSMLPYDRTSYLDFCLCALTFAISLSTGQDVLRYFWRKGKKRFFWALVRGMLIYYAGVALLALIWWPAAVILVVGRFFHGVSEAGIAWPWHALFEPDDPTNNYTNSITISVTLEAWGQYLHAEHHERMARHWSLYEQDYKASTEYRQHQSNELDPVLLPQFLGLMFSRRFRTIGQLFTHQRASNSPEALEALVQRRLVKVPSSERPLFPVGVERAISSVAARTMLGKWAPR